jgi:hypothetical protein
VQAGAFGDIARIISGVLRRVGTGHRDSEDPVRPEGITCDCGGQCGVDSAGQAEDDASESVLVHIVGKAELKGAVCLLLIAE